MLQLAGNIRDKMPNLKGFIPIRVKCKDSNQSNKQIMKASNIKSNNLTKKKNSVKRKKPWIKLATFTHIRP